jgi:hypothetical protein
MRLSRTCLTIRHYGAIESIKDIVENWISHIVEDFLLSAIHIEDIIKHERHVFRFMVFYY